MKKLVATDVATPKHDQDTQECLTYNHKKEEPNKTHREYLENLFFRLPPSATSINFIIGEKEVSQYSCQQKLTA
jgi:hypothetical protein